MAETSYGEPTRKPGPNWIKRIIHTVIGVAIVWGGCYCIFGGNEGGVRLEGNLEQYAVDYLTENRLVDGGETILAYYDYTTWLNAEEGAVLTDRRVFHYLYDEIDASLLLESIADMQVKEEGTIGTIITLVDENYKRVKIEIAPWNGAEDFEFALEKALRKVE